MSSKADREERQVFLRVAAVHVDITYTWVYYRDFATIWLHMSQKFITT